MGVLLKASILQFVPVRRLQRYMSRQAWVLASIMECLNIDDYARALDSKV